MKVGFIGLGIMGKPMAKNLLKAGHQVCVNDFHKEAVEELVAAGATAGANNAEVAKGVDVVITMVPNYPNVRAALLGENGVAEGEDKDTVVIDMSSIDPVESKKIAAELKAKKKAGELHEYYKGKNIALIFEKTSTRTRCAFEVAAHDLGMGSTYLDPTGSQIGKKESIADTARVLGRMYEGIEYRGFGQDIVEELAKYAGVPVWNGLTNEYHPTQMLADMLTIREHFGDLKGRRLVYMGDARYNMGNSLMIACSKLGMHFVACTTKKYFPNQELVDLCRTYAEASGGSVTLTEDVQTGTKDADVIYTDVWVSMGEPDEVWEERIKDLTPYKVTADVMKNAGEKAIFLHCLPAFHDLKTKIGKEMGERFNLTDMEVTDEVFESAQSHVFDEAENRMHTIKAVMVATLGEPENK